ncbi:MAG: hypothetical protein C0507_12015 [Cyanobacteria bacterium PR.3.49]|nr:hypothetical protein [Cyanobacteria bacterium PR.3.49]
MSPTVRQYLLAIIVGALLALTVQFGYDYFNLKLEPGRSLTMHEVMVQFSDKRLDEPQVKALMSKVKPLMLQGVLLCWFCSRGEGIISSIAAGAFLGAGCVLANKQRRKAQEKPAT